MIKKTIKYTDIDGITREEDFYFNLTKAEIVELEVSRHGGFAESLQLLVESKDQQKLLSTIKEIILTAYGERSAQSRHFVKLPEYAEAFSHTEAFSNLFMELFQDADKATEFFSGLMPADLVEASRGQLQDHKPKQEVVLTAADEPHEFTLEELRSMTPEQFSKLKSEGLSL